jgi:hypothetical protein
MSHVTHEVPEGNKYKKDEAGMPEKDSAFHIAFAWLAALAASIAAWIGLS